MSNSKMTMAGRRSISSALLFASFCFKDACAFSLISPLVDLSHHLPTAAQALTLPPAVTDSFSLSPSITTSSLDTFSLDVFPYPLEEATGIYRDELQNEPMRTKVLTGIFLAVVGDALAQARVSEPYDVKRAASFAAFDGCYRAVQQITYPPMMQVCSGLFSASLLGMVGISTTTGALRILATTEQTFVSQLVIIPLVYYPCFFAITGAVQGLTVDETLTRAKETFIPLMKRNLLFWIPVQFSCFFFLEENLQIPVLTACGLIWTIILSVVAGSAKTAPEEQMEVAESALVDPEKTMKELEEPERLKILQKDVVQGGSREETAEIPR